MEASAHIPVMSGSRKRATQSRAQETIGIIVEAAARILEEDGYRAGSTNAIARRAGVSIGSLYQYFSSRDDVFKALVTEHQREIHILVEAAMERMARGEGQPSRILVDLLGDLLAFHSKRPRLMRAMETELAHFMEPSAAVDERRGVQAIVQAMAPAGRGSAEEALACAWLATEMTGLVSRRLAHAPPEGVAAEHVQTAFSRVMKALVG